MEGTSVTEQQVKLQQEIARIMTTQLVQEIRKLGMAVEAAAMAGADTESQLSIEGQFLTIDEGNRTRRLVIGLGAGASHVRMAVQVFETVAGQQRLVEDFYTNANSSRKPGFGPMAGAAAGGGHYCDRGNWGWHDRVDGTAGCGERHQAGGRRGHEGAGALLRQARLDHG
jgi:hypothetical protein